MAEKYTNAWKNGLNHCYQDPPAGTIFSHHFLCLTTATLAPRSNYRSTMVRLSRNSISCHLISRAGYLRWSHSQRMGGGHSEPAALSGKAPRPWCNHQKGKKCENKIRFVAPTNALYKYYTQLEPEHREELKYKALAKNKTGKEKMKTKKQDCCGQRGLDPLLTGIYWTCKPYRLPGIQALSWLGSISGLNLLSLIDCWWGG